MSIVNRLLSDNSAETIERSDLLVGIGKYGVLGALLASILLPYLYIISVSMRASTEVFSSPHWIPKEFTLEAWMTSWELIGPNMMNSFLAATGTVALALVIAVPGAYAFGRHDFPGKEIAFYLIVIALLFPHILLVIPITDAFRQLQLYDTIPGLILAYQAFVTPFAIWILRDFFEKLPSNIEEAAQVYGKTKFGAFRSVVLPLSKPAMMAAGFLAFLTAWNDFFFAAMLTSGPGSRTAVVALYVGLYTSESLPWTLVMAMALMIGTPPVVMYLTARRYLAQAFSFA